MLKRRIFVPIFAALAINLALTGFLFTQAKVTFAQLATLTPPEEPAQAATPAPAEEAPPAEPTPTAAPVQEAAPAVEATPTEAAAPAEEATPAESTPSTMPVTGLARNPLTIMLVVAGAVVVLGGLSAFSNRRKRME
jgi:hypothetical protein